MLQAFFSFYFPFLSLLYFKSYKSVKRRSGRLRKLAEIIMNDGKHIFFSSLHSALVTSGKLLTSQCIIIIHFSFFIFQILRRMIDLECLKLLKSWLTHVCKFLRWNLKLNYRFEYFCELLKLSILSLCRKEKL